MGNGRARVIITDTEWEAIRARLGIPRRQLQIVQAFINKPPGGAKPESIGRALQLHPSTVKTHMDRLYRNLGAHDRGDIIICVYEELMKLRGLADVRRSPYIEQNHINPPNGLADRSPST